jgi:predicted HD phosphohydrolase
MSDGTKTPRATFKDMASCTQEDWAIILPQYMELARGLADRVMAHMEAMRGDFAGFPVDRLDHCLQTAGLAHADGRDEEYVVCALLHDMGDGLGPYNHADIAAAVLKPFVSPENHFMVEKHAVFQGYYFFHHVGLDRNMRDALRGHPCYERTAEFCAKYDGPAFDARRETRPLSFFEPMVRRVLAKPKHSMYQAAVERAQEA